MPDDVVSQYPEDSSAPPSQHGDGPNRGHCLSTQAEPRTDQPTEQKQFTDAVHSLNSTSSDGYFADWDLFDSGVGGYDHLRPYADALRDDYHGTQEPADTKMVDASLEHMISMDVTGPDPPPPVLEIYAPLTPVDHPSPMCVSNAIKDESDEDTMLPDRSASKISNRSAPSATPVVTKDSDSSSRSLQTLDGVNQLREVLGNLQRKTHALVALVGPPEASVNVLSSLETLCGQLSANQATPQQRSTGLPVR